MVVYHNSQLVGHIRSFEDPEEGTCLVGVVLDGTLRPYELYGYDTEEGLAAAMIAVFNERVAPQHLDFVDVTGMTAEDVRRMGHADE